jgi:predicted FMN-binding regulatory protein PaiB
MIHYDYYADVPEASIEAFVRGSELGRLVTVAADGTPHIGLYPFVYHGPTIEMHLHRADTQLADLRAQARCLFEVDEVLAVIPSYWVHPENAVMATAYHRTVIFDCEVVVSEDPERIAAQQMRLLARYQPEGGFRPVSADDPMYRGALGHIAALELAVRGRAVKFKLAQNRPPEVRVRVAGELRNRGRHQDAHAAAALESTIGRDAPRSERPS